MKIGCQIPIKEPRPIGCKQIKQEIKEKKVHMDRRHFPLSTRSLEGPTSDNQRPGLKMFAHRHKPTLQD